MTKRFVSILLTLVLFFQISNITFSIQWPAIEYGSFADHINIAKKRVATALVQQASLAKQTNEIYVSIVFTGDVMLARNLEFLMKNKGISYPFSGLQLTNLAPNSAIVGNFEASMAPQHKTTPADSLTFSVPTTSLLALSEAGFTHVSLGNNHSFDYEESGFNFTQEQLQKTDITSFGNERTVNAESISYLQLANEKVALIGINFLQSYSRDEIFELLKQASKNSSKQIAYVHWGEEYDLYHSTQQERQAKMLIEAGVDLIVGHHPHVVQGVDIIDGVAVFYSLGNYVFDQYFSRDVQEGLVLSLKYEDGFIVDIVPVTSSAVLSQPQIMEPADYADFLSVLSRKSNTQVASQVQNGTLYLGNSVATSSKMAIMNQ